jgi:CubicO group peptidase (beta-lactamase class C family)
MKRASVLVLSVFVLLGSVAPSTKSFPTAGPPPRLLKKSVKSIASGLKSEIPDLMRKAGIPGLQIALVRKGRVFWERSFGVKNAETGAPVTNETLFEAASLTKPFFAYAVMKLVDEGTVDLDKPVHTYFTRAELEAHLDHSLEAPGFKRDWFERITARHILSHSGGLPHGEGGEVVPVFFEPGTQWKYSADGYELLQRAVEKLKGAKLDAIMQTYVLDPLGMKRSGMVWRPAFEAVMANGHSLFGKPQAFRKREEAIASASLYTTAGEYARFVCAVLAGEGLRPETAMTMLTSFISLNEDKSLGWSLGFGLQKDANGKAFWQWGDYGIFRNYIIAYPEPKAAVVYLTNSFNGLSICPDVVGRSVGGQALGNAYLNYRRFDSAFYALLRGAKEGGPARLIALLPEMRKKDPKDLTLETLGNMAGLMDDEGLPAEAVVLLEDIYREKPRSGQAAFGLARATLLLGDLEKARRYYQAAEGAEEDKVEPKDIRWDLGYLEAAQNPVALDRNYMEALAGDYGARRLSVKDGRLHYFREAGTAPEPRPLLALTKDTFFIQGTVWFRIKVEFDAAGRPAKLVGLYNDGRRDESIRNK